ncbi:MAG: hypothetical protein WC471_06100 [Candidatus Woesearchaeota archaeon]|jgi:hypothetical protein
MRKIFWKEEVINIQQLLSSGYTTEEIGKQYGVTKQRIYQVMTKFGLVTGSRKRKNFLRDKEPKYYWFNHALTRKGLPKSQRTEILATFVVPDNCPMLGIQLNYDGTGGEGWSREDNSPSIDRINSTLGYTKENIQIISWRANRIKNDSTPEELMMIAQYMSNLTKKELQV